MNWIQNQFDSRNKNRLERTRISVNMNRAAEWKKQVEAKGGSIYYINDKEVTKQTADYRRFKSIVESSLLLQQSEDRRNQRNRADPDGQTESTQVEHTNTPRSDSSSLPRSDAEQLFRPRSQSLPIRIPDQCINSPSTKPRNREQRRSSSNTADLSSSSFRKLTSPAQKRSSSTVPRKLDNPFMNGIRFSSIKPKSPHHLKSSSSPAPTRPGHISSFTKSTSHRSSSPFPTPRTPDAILSSFTMPRNTDQDESSPFPTHTSPGPLLSSSFSSMNSKPVTSSFTKCISQSDVFSFTEPKEGYFW